jgi:type I restriction-modification system DNA methylase subunit
METTLLEQFNAGLLDLRESFHKTGRLDDSNTKLDEISKLLCLEVVSVYHPKSGISSLKSILEQHRNTSGIIKSINSALVKVAKMDVFCDSHGESLLGANPKLSLPESEDEIANKMASLIVETFNGHLRSASDQKSFELVNESFGHFVRDNFRNNIEDAQYMTPPEVVNFICNLALDEITLLSKKNAGEKIVICDPSCGVGSFLAQFYKLYLHSDLLRGKELTLVGQDKVDRMARLAKLNLLLFGYRNSVIERGNSLLQGSVLDKFHGKCDLILTNPPFGARFHTTELSFHSTNFFPCLHNFIQTTNTNLDSELLFIDRYLSLLKPGGSAFVVVPDAIISATGVAKLMRDYLGNNCSVASITELPAVTFAQAGTRTKTCVIHFRKQEPIPDGRVFLSCAKSLGFEVASRKGVPYKRYEGQDDLPLILQSMRSAYKKHRAGQNEIYSKEPSCVSIQLKRLLEEPWTPNHHSATRYGTLGRLNENSLKGGAELLRLRDMVILPNKHIRNSKLLHDTKCISVLHVGDFGFLNVRELMSYAPKYPGQHCKPGDVLFSKINPRIPRALVVPDLGFPLSCSKEFEVMSAREPFSAYEIMVLLLSSQAQSQIQSLTSGTSSSHNRIKTEQLLDILLPIPKERKREKSEYRRLVEDFSRAHASLVQAGIVLHKSLQEINEKLLV